jgi:hypothetical protein
MFTTIYKRKVSTDTGVRGKSIRGKRQKGINVKE